MKWHRFTSDPAKREQWTKLIRKGRENFQPDKERTFVHTYL